MDKGDILLGFLIGGMITGVVGAIIGVVALITWTVKTVWGS